MACCICIDQGTVGIVENLGKFSKVVHPGFNMLTPCLESQVGTVSTRVQQLDVTCETKTLDNVFVQMVVSVQYTPMDTDQAKYDAYYKLTDPEQQMRAYVFDCVRSSVPKIILDNVFELKDTIAQEIKASLMDSMNSFGYEIIETLVTDIQPDYQVKCAMNEINANQRLRLAAQEKAEAQKILQVKAAEADAESKYLAGLGISRQRQAIVNGLRDSVNDFSSAVHGTTASQIMDMMVLTQYFDMLSHVGKEGRSSTLVLAQNPGAMTDVARQLKSGFIKPTMLSPPKQVM